MGCSEIPRINGGKYVSVPIHLKMNKKVSGIINPVSSRKYEVINVEVALEHLKGKC